MARRKKMKINSIAMLVILFIIAALVSESKSTFIKTSLTILLLVLLGTWGLKYSGGQKRIKVNVSKRTYKKNKHLIIGGTTLIFLYFAFASGILLNFLTIVSVGIVGFFGIKAYLRFSQKQKLLRSGIKEIDIMMGLFLKFISKTFLRRKVILSNEPLFRVILVQT